MIAGYYRIRI